VQDDRSSIRLPCSSGRARHAYLKLLARVDPDAQNGFGFEGSLLRPGAWATSAELRPSAEYPEIPVLLEYSSVAAHGIPGRRRADSLYVLWRWEPRTHQWRELGRAVSVAWEWAVELRPLALRALAEARGSSNIIEIPPDFAAIASEIAGFLDERLRILPARDRARLLAVLHDQFAMRRCA
jgi:hypothetical protein